MKISRLLTMVGVVFVLIVLASVVLEAAEQARRPVSLGSALQEYDFGDAPDPTYPTLLASDGARHLLDGEHYLGDLVDAEPDGQPDPFAIGDDDAGVDDEDGVFLSPLRVGQRNQVDVIASTSGLLNAWMDYNLDGDWLDSGEQIFADEPLVAGTNNLVLSVPSTAAAGSTFSRWRFSDQGGLDYFTPIEDPPPFGEVEDYMVQILALYGWLDGFVMDNEEGDSATCTAASVQIDPGSIVVNADSFTGYFGPVELAAGVYTVQASAPGYSTETVPGVAVASGVTTTQYLYLERPVVRVQPEDLISVTAAISQPATYGLAITNEGSQDLDFEIGEGPAGEDLPWAWEDPISGTIPPGLGLEVDVTFHCTEAGDYEGALVILNGDPCRSEIIVPIVLHCQAPPVWDKWVNDQPWSPELPVPVQVSDTIKVVDTFTAVGPFALEETWDPAHLDLRDWAVEPSGLGEVVPGPGHLLWDVPPDHPEVVTITKWFHVEPCTWLETELTERLWVGQEVIDLRPVIIQKEPPQLWIDAAWDPEALAGEPVTFTLLYRNLGGRETGVVVWNDFPREAPFVDSDPPPTDSGAAGDFAMWAIDRLDKDQSGSIVVTATLVPSLLPSTTVVITDAIYDHAGNEWDRVIIDFHVGGSAGPPLADLGDAPDSTNHAGVTMTAYPAPVPSTVTGQYPSVFDPATGLPQGPLHREPLGDAWLGTWVSREFDADLLPDEEGWPNLDPPSDQADRDGFDDGLRPPVRLPNCVPTTITYTVTITPGVSTTPRYINVWFDWNRDGDWADLATCEQLNDASEWAVQNQIVILGRGVHVLQTPLFLPYNKVPDQPLWTRISIAEQPAPHPEDGRGPATGYRYGETEDYLLPGEGGPAVEWHKLIDGISWQPGITFTVETSDTIMVQDVITVPDPETPFELAENWDPEQLVLSGWEVLPAGTGEVITGDGFLEWEVPSTPPQVITLTKWFHVEPSTWRQTTLLENLRGPQVDEPSRPVVLVKTPPDLRLAAVYDPGVYAGDVATFTLLYSNAGGYENNVVIRNLFPPEALFVDATPPPLWQAPDGSEVKWKAGDLATGDKGQIEVVVAIAPGLQPSSTLVISDFIYNHAGEAMDSVEIELHVDDSPPQSDDHDLYMKDNSLDDGSVPSSAPWWLSPDLWVRNDGDCTNPHHQNPVGGSNSTICVRIRNRMATTIDDITLNVYWGSAALGFHWPGGWSVAGSAYVANLAPGTEAVRAILWSTPNITGHFCLLARADSPDDPIGSGPDTATPADHVPNNNNLSMRNLNIVGFTEITGCGFSTTVTESDTVLLDVVNTNDQAVTIDLLFNSADFPLDTGQIALEPGGLWGRWTTLDNFDDAAAPPLTLTGFPAKIGGITMNPYETVPMTVTITAEIDEWFTLYVSEQRLEGEIVGGVAYLRRLPQCVSLPVILRQYTPSTRAVERLPASPLVPGGARRR